MLEENNAFTMVLLDLSSLQTNVHKIANYWLAALSIRDSTGSTGTEVGLLSYLDNPMFILSMLW